MYTKVYTTDAFSRWAASLASSGHQMTNADKHRKSHTPRLAEEAVSCSIHKISDNIYTNLAMKTLILIKRLRLCHVLIRLLCLLSTLPPHKQFPAAVTPPVFSANLLHLLPLLGRFELSLVPHLNSPSTTLRELLGDRGPRKSLPLQPKDLCVIRWRVSRPVRS